MAITLINRRRSGHLCNGQVTSVDDIGFGRDALEQQWPQVNADWNDERPLRNVSQMSRVLA